MKNIADTTIGNIHVQVIGNRDDYTLVKLYYPCITNINGIRNEHYKGIVVAIRPEDLYDISKNCVFPQYVLRPKDE